MAILVIYIFWVILSKPREKGAFYNEYMYGIFGAVPNISGD